jgi:hypothetical protein
MADFEASLLNTKSPVAFIPARTALVVGYHSWIDYHSWMDGDRFIPGVEPCSRIYITGV